MGAQNAGAGQAPAPSADTGRAQEPALNAVKGPPLRPVVVKIVDFGIAKLRESGIPALRCSTATASPNWAKKRGQKMLPNRSSEKTIAKPL